MSSNITKAASGDDERQKWTGKLYSANYKAIQKASQDLPVVQHMDAVMKKLDEFPVLVLVAEPGSGKTTQLPKEIALRLDLIVAVTQNRRLATSMVGGRCAEELDVVIGEHVGVKHKGMDRTSSANRLVILTDGSFLVTARSNPTFKGYGAIVIDEAHQHTVPTDQLLGLLKRLAKKRPELKIVIMSATMDKELFLKYFEGAGFYEVPGKAHDVLIHYSKTDPEDVEVAVVEAILYVHANRGAGNILVFVSGAVEIKKAIKGVRKAFKPDTGTPRFSENEVGPLECWPLHAGLSPEEQDAAVDSVAPVGTDGKNGRKIIVATNIAETAVTITGVNFVIDSGKVKTKSWNPVNETVSLREVNISQAQAKQRGGRAGRERPGEVFRLYSERTFYEEMAPHSVADIMKSDLLSETLQCLKMGEDPNSFPWIVPPSVEAQVKAYGMLRQLGAITPQGDLLPRGHAILELQTDVFHAAVLLESHKQSCSDQMVSLVAMIQASEGTLDVWIDSPTPEDETAIKNSRLRFQHPSSEHLLLFNIYLAWREAGFRGNTDEFIRENRLKERILRAADQNRDQLLATLARRQERWKDWEPNSPHPGSASYYTQMVAALAMGKYMQVAKRINEPPPVDKKNKKEKVRPRYQVARTNEIAFLAPGTDLGVPSVDNEWVIFHDFLDNGPATRFLRLVTAIPVELLIRAQPAYWKDVEFFPEGHIQDCLVNAITRMNTQTPESIRGRGMPAPTEPPK